MKNCGSLSSFDEVSNGQMIINNKYINLLTDSSLVEIL